MYCIYVILPFLSYNIYFIDSNNKFSNICKNVRPLYEILLVCLLFLKTQVLNHCYTIIKSVEINPPPPKKKNNCRDKYLG